MEERQEKSLDRSPTENSRSPQIIKFDDLDEELKLAILSAADKKAEHIVALDLRSIASFTEFFVIASGTNQRQVQAIADEVSERLKKETSLKPIRIEGYNAAEWVLLDYGDFIFHIFNAESRDFYDLARLWRDAGRVEIPEDL